uniref:NADP-dependent oxidoreductase domain-containing protein n=1 Tax=Oryza barthii TaxID=65489 RepID=A0A0D3GM58_9ORYZ
MAAAAMALQVVAAGGGCCCQRPVLGPDRRRRLVAAARAAAAAKVSEEGKVRLGGSDVAVSKLGIGAWSWGDTTYWNDSEWDDRRLQEAKAAFDTSIDNGMTFFDTAEVYGTAERREKEQIDVAVATKFAALPWRFGRGSVLSALKKSLDHAYEQGLVKAVGVSNYNEKRLRDAYARLKKRGVPLAANQVNYSLIYRTPELNGVKAACDELGITLIAYSPIAQGVLSGKYTPEKPPTGPRANTYTPEFLTKLQPLMNRIKEIGESYGKNPTQVSLNWLTCQGNVVPIPGAKNAGQAQEFAGALGWSLTGDEVEELRSLAREIKGIKMPIEES